jgi:hypothetical protein
MKFMSVQNSSTEFTKKPRKKRENFYRFVLSILTVDFMWQIADKSRWASEQNYRLLFASR